MGKSYQFTCDDAFARLTGEPCPVHPWRRGRPRDDGPGAPRGFPGRTTLAVL